MKLVKIIDRYIISELLLPLLSGILAFSFILAGSTILPGLVSDAIKYQIPLTDFLVLIALKIPWIFSLSMPMATLFATITVFGRLGNDLEIIALRANGVSVLRLIFPTIFTGLCISLLAFSFTENIVPQAAKTAQTIFLNYRNQNKPIIQKNINISEYDAQKNPKRIINIGQFRLNKLENITISEFDNGQLSRLIRSKHGQWLSEGAWQFDSGIMHSFSALDPKKITIVEFDKEIINLDITPKNIHDRKKGIEEMNRKELLEKIEFQKRSGEDPIKFIMDYHLKVSIAFSCLIYSILGASMGLQPHRSSSALGLGLSLVVIFIYVVLMSVGMGLGLSKALPPLIAAWFPNIIVGFFSLVLLSKRARQ